MYAVQYLTLALFYSLEISYNYLSVNLPTYEIWYWQSLETVEITQKLFSQKNASLIAISLHYLPKLPSLVK